MIHVENTITISGNDALILKRLCHQASVRFETNHNNVDSFNEMHWSQFGMDAEEAKEMDHFINKIFEHVSSCSCKKCEYR